jgi:hypothetical protein
VIIGNISQMVGFDFVSDHCNAEGLNPCYKLGWLERGEIGSDVNGQEEGVVVKVTRSSIESQINLSRRSATSLNLSYSFINQTYLYLESDNSINLASTSPVAPPLNPVKLVLVLLTVHPVNPVPPLHDNLSPLPSRGTLDAHELHETAGLR